MGEMTSRGSEMAIIFTSIPIAIIIALLPPCVIAPCPTALAFTPTFGSQSEDGACDQLPIGTGWWLAQTSPVHGANSLTACAEECLLVSEDICFAFDWQEDTATCYFNTYCDSQGAAGDGWIACSRPPYCNTCDDLGFDVPSVD